MIQVNVILVKQPAVNDSISPNLLSVVALIAKL